MAFHLLQAAALGLIVLAQVPSRTGSEWPGLWGPARSGVASGSLPWGTRIEVLWRRANEGGFSEIAVRGGRAYTMELRGGTDFIVALDAATGREVWTATVGPTFPGNNGSPPGPMSTPAVGESDLFALGPHGHLIAVDLASGKERWRHDLRAAYGARSLDWGFAASPLIEGSLVIVPSGGDRGLLAFDRASGKLAWNAAVAKQPAYSSATVATIGGVRQVIASAGDAVFAVRPADGRVLWSTAGPGGDVGNSPIVLPGDRVLVSSFPQSQLIGVSQSDGVFTARDIWRTAKLRGSNGVAVFHDGLLYGIAGPQLLAMHPDTTDVVWRERTNALSLMFVGGHLALLSQESGELQLGAISASGFKPVHSSQVLTPGVTAVTAPSFAGGRFFVRNIKEIVAFQLK